MSWVAVGAVALNFASGLIKGAQQSKSYKAQAKLMEQQAAVYRKNAALLRRNGARNEDIMRSGNRAQLSRAAAAGGEAGMGESATFASGLATTAAALEQNVLNARYQTESQAENYLYDARLTEEKAKLLRKRSENSFRNGLIGGINSALSTANTYDMLK
ncbi:MAG: hypothetical protein J6C85_00920 [Alphaproteobacteria bacterium]|nr:hypothetical protein [Alphaproteobacteria bacterium]